MSKGTKMSRRLNRGIGITLSVFQILVFLMLWDEGGEPWLLTLAAAYTLTFMLRGFLLPFELKPWLNFLYVFVQLSLAFGIVMLDGQFISQVYLFILLAESAFSIRPRYSITVMLLSYLAFVIGHWIHYDYPSFDEISYVVPRSFEYLTFYGFAFLAQYALRQKQKLSQSYEKLAAFSAELERKTLLEERTRISRDIHDTVGHTLTSAITGLATAIRFVDDDRDLSLDMMKQTKDMIQNGLQDVRRSVHLLHEEKKFPDFIAAIRALIEDTRRQTGVEISATIDERLPRFAVEVELAFYRALQEGLTNGARHGESTVFEFSLKQVQDEIHFLLTNNGKPWNDPPFGFGLSSMKSRVTAVGGSLAVRRGENNRGTAIDIKVPFKSRKEALHE